VVDNRCLTDFLMIPCATDQQDQGQIFSGPGQLALAGSTIGPGCVGKICGGTFAAVTGTGTPAPVYSESLTVALTQLNPIFNSFTLRSN
jgi:hypothetical protein